MTLPTEHDPGAESPIFAPSTQQPHRHETQATSNQPASVSRARTPVLAGPNDREQTPASTNCQKLPSIKNLLGEVEQSRFFQPQYSKVEPGTQGRLDHQHSIGQGLTRQDVATCLLNQDLHVTIDVRRKNGQEVKPEEALGISKASREYLVSLDPRLEHLIHVQPGLENLKAKDLKLLASMRSPKALRQIVICLLEHRESHGHPHGEKSLAPEPDYRYLKALGGLSDIHRKRVAQCCQCIFRCNNIASPSLLSKLLARFCKFHLARIIEAEIPRKSTGLWEDIKKISHLDEKTARGAWKIGKTLMHITGNHVGMLLFLPLTKEFGFGVCPSNIVDDCTKAAAQQINNMLPADTAATMCRLGQDVLSTILSDRPLSPRFQELVEQGARPDDLCVLRYRHLLGPWSGEKGQHRCGLGSFGCGEDMPEWHFKRR